MAIKLKVNKSFIAYKNICWKITLDKNGVCNSGFGGKSRYILARGTSHIAGAEVFKGSGD